MENNKNNMSSRIEEMKRLVREKAETLLKDFTADSLNYFEGKASTIAIGILEKYVFSIYDMFTIGDFAIKDLKQREVFTNFRTGYQQKMLDWIEQNKPKIELIVEIPSHPTEQSEKRWHYVALGIGTAGALGFEIGRRCNDGERYWIGILIELVTLVTSYLIYKKEKSDSENFSKKLTEYELEIKKRKEILVNEAISQLEKWLKDGEAYSNELLSTFNLL